MRILLTNDDGINAEGLAVLRRIAAELSDDVWTVAPEYEQSGASRALTLADPLRVRALEPKTFAVTGTPTDCVMLALRALVTGPLPDLVLSGVNRGQNIAEDVTMSGTVAGAIEGMALGVPAIALSQAMRRMDDDLVVHWETAERLGPQIVRRLLDLGWPADVVINVNFPARPVEEVQGVRTARQGAREAHPRHPEKRRDTRGRDYYWIGFEPALEAPPSGTDIAAMAEGFISVTPLHIDMTHQQTLARLQGALAEPLAGLDPRSPR